MDVVLQGFAPNSLAAKISIRSEVWCENGIADRVQVRNDLKGKCQRHVGDLNKEF